MTLKLFVWENVLTDYSDGIMFALAETVEQAREVIIKKDPGAYFKGGVMHNDLLKEPKIIDTAEGFLLWGGA